MLLLNCAFCRHGEAIDHRNGTFAQSSHGLPLPISCLHAASSKKSVEQESVSACRIHDTATRIALLNSALATPGNFANSAIVMPSSAHPHPRPERLSLTTELTRRLGEKHWRRTVRGEFPRRGQERPRKGERRGATSQNIWTVSRGEKDAARPAVRVSR